MISIITDTNRFIDTKFDHRSAFCHIIKDIDQFLERQRFLQYPMVAFIQKLSYFPIEDSTGDEDHPLCQLLALLFQGIAASPLYAIWP